MVILQLMYSHFLGCNAAVSVWIYLGLRKMSDIK